MLRGVPEYTDLLQIAGHAVVGDYDEQKYELHVELMKLQNHAVETGSS